MIDPNMGFWESVQERIPGVWRVFALARKVRSKVRYAYDEVHRKITFSWPIYDVWRYFLNREPKILYRIHKTHMSPNSLEQQVINELAESGISVIHFNDLFPARQFKDLQESAEIWLQKPTNQSRIKEIQSGPRVINSKKTFSTADKFYLVRLLGDKPVFDLKDTFLELSLSEQVLRIVCGYLRMFSRLVYVDLWYNVATDGPDAFSQRWHRDPDDRKQVKLFLYLRDVNEGNGPFCYIPGTHNVGRFKRIYPQTIYISNYPPDGAVEKKFTENQRRVCTGTAGTLIFSDTTGFHKGGHPVTEGRLLFTAVYTTNAGTPLITRAKAYSIGELQSDFISRPAEYAISHLKE